MKKPIVTSNNAKVNKTLVTKTLLDSPLTPARKRKLAAASARHDRETDLSDIPELGEHFWANAVRNPYYRPTNANSPYAWMQTWSLGSKDKAKAIKPA